MLLKIQKVDNHILKIELTTDTKKKPVQVTLTPAQVQSLISTLQMAARSDAFTFSYSV